MQLANNNQVDDFRSGVTYAAGFSGKALELKYFLKDEKAVLAFLANIKSVKANVENVRRDLKFSKIICRFFFGKYVPSKDLQKQLAEVQEDIFDEVTIQLIGTNLETFKAIFESTNNTTKKPISVLIDVRLNMVRLSQIANYLKIWTPANIRCLYRKIGNNMNLIKYDQILTFAKEAGINAYLVGCNKRFGKKLDAYANVDVSLIMQKIGFAGCCLNYCPAAERKNKKGFAPNTDVLDIATYEWITEKNNGYQQVRLDNYLKQDSADLSDDAIKARENFAKLLVHLKQPQK